MATQDYTSLALSLANSYNVLSCTQFITTGLTSTRFSQKYIVIPFSNAYLFTFLLAVLYSVARTFFTEFCTFVSFPFSFDLVWQPGFLINMDGYRYHFTLMIMMLDQGVLTLFTFEIFSKKCDQMAVAINNVYFQSR